MTTPTRPAIKAWSRAKRVKGVRSESSKGGPRTISLTHGVVSRESAVGDPLPFTGEGDRRSRWRGVPHAPSKVLPPTVALGATIPRAREEDSRLRGSFTGGGARE